MIQILEKYRLEIKSSLKSRNRWPVNDQVGIDPLEREHWQQFLNSPMFMAPVITRDLPRLGIEPDEELHRLLSVPEFLYFSWGNARPHVLWVQKIKSDGKAPGICSPHLCGELEYLEAEESVHGLSALEAALFKNN